MASKTLPIGVGAGRTYRSRRRAPRRISDAMTVHPAWCPCCSQSAAQQRADRQRDWLMWPLGGALALVAIGAIAIGQHADAIAAFIGGGR